MERYLQHHGIKGQKWGVRRYQNPDGSYTDAGLNRYGYDKTLTKNKNLYQKYRMHSAQKVASRLNNMSNERKSIMSDRQRISYNRSKKYWEARALGKTTPKRGLIKRSYDKYRSHSFKSRAAQTAAYNVAGAASSKYILKKYGQAISRNSIFGQEVGSMIIEQANNIKVKDIVRTSAQNTAVTLGHDEIINRLFGHY